MEIPRFEISSRYTTDVWILSDLHLGHKKCDLGLFQRYLDWLGAKKTRRVLGLGDYLETVLPTTMKGKAIWDQDKDPGDQIDEFIEMMSPYKKQILGFVDGNHEKRVTKATSYSPVKMASIALDVPYLGYYGWMCFDSGNVQYYAMYHHGKGSSTTIDYPFRKLTTSGFHGVDMRFVAHAHSFGWIPKSYFMVNFEKGVLERRICHDIRCGGFLLDPEYSMIAMYPVAAMGSPIVQFNSKVKSINVRFGLQADGSFGLPMEGVY